MSVIKVHENVDAIEARALTARAFPDRQTA